MATAPAGTTAAKCFAKVRITLEPALLELLRAEKNGARRFSQAVQMKLHAVRARVSGADLVVHAVPEVVASITRAIAGVHNEGSLDGVLTALSGRAEAPAHLPTPTTKCVIIRELLVRSKLAAPLIHGGVIKFFETAHLVRLIIFPRLDMRDFTTVFLLGPLEGVESVEKYIGTAGALADKNLNPKGTGMRAYYDSQARPVKAEDLSYQRVVVRSRVYTSSRQVFGGTKYVCLISEEEASRPGVLTVPESTRYCGVLSSPPVPSSPPPPSSDSSTGPAKRKAPQAVEAVAVVDAMDIDEATTNMMDVEGPAHQRPRTECSSQRLDSAIGDLSLGDKPASSGVDPAPPTTVTSVGPGPADLVAAVPCVQAAAPDEGLSATFTTHKPLQEALCDGLVTVLWADADPTEQAEVASSLKTPAAGGGGATDFAPGVLVVCRPQGNVETGNGSVRSTSVIVERDLSSMYSTLVISGPRDNEADAKLKLAFSVFLSSFQLLERYGGPPSTHAQKVTMFIVQTQFDKLVGPSSTLAWFVATVASAKGWKFPMRTAWVGDMDAAGNVLRVGELQTKLRAAVEDPDVALVVVPAANMDEEGNFVQLDATGERTTVRLQGPTDRRLLVLGVKTAFEALDIANLWRLGGETVPSGPVPSLLDVGRYTRTHGVLLRNCHEPVVQLHAADAFAVSIATRPTKMFAASGEDERASILQRATSKACEQLGLEGPADTPDLSVITSLSGAGSQMATACPASMGACVLATLVGYTIPDGIVIVGGLLVDGCLDPLVDCCIGLTFLALVRSQHAKAVILPSRQRVDEKLDCGEIQMHRATHLSEIPKIIVEYLGGQNGEGYRDRAQRRAGGETSSGPSRLSAPTRACGDSFPRPGSATPSSPSSPQSCATPDSTVSTPSAGTPEAKNSKAAASETEVHSPQALSTRASSRTRKPKPRADDIISAVLPSRIPVPNMEVPEGYMLEVISVSTIPRGDEGKRTVRIRKEVGGLLHKGLGYEHMLTSGYFGTTNGRVTVVLLEGDSVVGFATGFNKSTPPPVLAGFPKKSFYLEAFVVDSDHQGLKKLESGGGEKKLSVVLVEFMYVHSENIGLDVSARVRQNNKSSYYRLKYTAEARDRPFIEVRVQDDYADITGELEYGKYRAWKEAQKGKPQGGVVEENGHEVYTEAKVAQIEGGRALNDKHGLLRLYHVPLKEPE